MTAKGVGREMRRGVNVIMICRRRLNKFWVSGVGSSLLSHMPTYAALDDTWLAGELRHAAVAVQSPACW